jgi:LPLT family lysophospholipid transporter-like MFS transporter
VGALAAGRWVRLHQAPRVLPLGVLMGACVPLLTLVHSVGVAAPLLAAVGALAGFFVVPMNALLQHRGQQLLGAGESIAVQNFNENLSVLAMLGAYAALQMTGWPLHRTVFALGSVVALGVLSVMWRYRLVGARRQLLEGEQT